MGTFRVQIQVGNPYGGDFTPVSALVDTGATYSMMPDSLLTALRLVPDERIRFRIADGNRVEFDVGEARFQIDGKSRTCTVIFGPEDRYLLGATALEDFGLMVDPYAPNPSLVPLEELDL